MINTLTFQYKTDVDGLTFEYISASCLIHLADCFPVCIMTNIACSTNELWLASQSTVGEHRPLTVSNHDPLKLLKYQPWDLKTHLA